MKSYNYFSVTLFLIGVTMAAVALESTCSTSASSSCEFGTVIPPLDRERLQLIERKTGAKLVPLEPIGALVYGLDLRQPRPSDEIIQALQAEMAHRGFLVFKNQDLNFTTDHLVQATKWWGAQQLHSTHGVHPATPKSPNQRHIFRLSNDRSQGHLGVGPQWHNDGSFEVAPFSHVAYHMVQVPLQGGGTLFGHQGAAFDQLPFEDQEYWSRLASVNSNSGVVHPVVHTHPISGRKSVWLHLGMTGAVIEHSQGRFRLLHEDELRRLFVQYNTLLNDGLVKGYTLEYDYQPGDVVFIDNYAVAHRASPKAHLPASTQGLRILHRTTCQAPFPAFAPDLHGLPQHMDIHGPDPFGNGGVWIGGGIGFRFDETLQYQN